MIEHDARGSHLDSGKIPVDVRHRPFRHVENEVVLARGEGRAEVLASTVVGTDPL